MSTILDDIVRRKREEVSRARARVEERELERLCASAPPVRDLCAVLDGTLGIQVIAEVKKASPSAGILRVDFDPVGIAQVYAARGAAAVSVLTDEPFFQGKLDHLSEIRASILLPVLRKDFILDRYQLLQARAAGADAVLLIAEILEGAQLSDLVRESRKLGLQVLVELYESRNLTRVLECGARLIGVNNRDLRTFTTRLEHTLELKRDVPSDRLLVSESGIKNRQDVLRLEEAGVRAVLVGETLMRAPDIGAKLDELRGAQAPPRAPHPQQD